MQPSRPGLRVISAGGQAAFESPAGRACCVSWRPGGGVPAAAAAPGGPVLSAAADLARQSDGDLEAGPARVPSGRIRVSRPTGNWAAHIFFIPRHSISRF